MSDVVKYNEQTSRYEMAVGPLTVFAKVRRKGDVVYVTHVEAPQELRGKGAAGLFMEGLMNLARAENFKISPVCPYAVAWLGKRPEYSDLVTE